MKSRDLKTKTGMFMGIPFELKPIPMRVDLIIEEHRDMLMDWYEENYPTLKEKIESGSSIDDLTTEEIEGVNAWKKDVDFRAKYIRFTAENSMQFEKPVPEDYWRSDDLPLSVVDNAWSFFTGRSQLD